MIKSEIINIFEFFLPNVHYYRYDINKNVVLYDNIIKFDLLKETLKINKNDDDSVWIILPRSILIEKYLNIPSMDKNEIDQMANIQASKLMPFAHDEIITYSHLIKSTDDGYSTILLYVISKEKLVSLLTPIITLGYMPDNIFISPLLSQKIIEEKKQATASISNHFIQLYDKYIEVGLLEMNKLLYSRQLEGGFKSNQDFSKLQTEINETFEYISKKSFVELTEACYLISSYNSGDLGNFYQDNLKYELVSFNNNDKFQILNKYKSEISFVLESVNYKKNIRKDIIYALRSFFIIISMLCIISFYFLFENFSLTSKAVEIKKRITKIQKEAEYASELGEKLDIFSRHFSSSDNIILTIIEIYRLVPAQVVLTLLNFNDYKKINIKGISRNGIIDMVELLQKSKYFQNVSLKYENKLSSDEGKEFSIVCEMRNKYD